MIFCYTCRLEPRKIIVREASFSNWWGKMKTHGHTLGRTWGTLLKTGRKDSRRQTGQGPHKKLAHRINFTGLIGAHGD